MQLTRHFALAEFTRSQKAAERGIDNRPTADVIRALRLLCEKVLEPVRVHFGRPVIVTSGYRSTLVNAAVGGAPGSQHRLGEAADFTVSGASNIEVCRFIAETLPFDQLIYEFGESGWIHCSYREGRLRMETLTFRKVRGRTRKFSGLIG